MIVPFVICLGVLLALTSALQCPTSDASKIDCGYVGITESQCTAKNCCWASSSNSNVPWCFYSSSQSSCYAYNGDLSLPFSASEMSTMTSNFMANINIQGQGGIVAAPDYNTPGGSYYFHWMRDAALTMRTLQTVNSFSSVESIVKSYINWVLKVQNEADPHNQDIRTEPKFNLPNGDVYTGSWCRPQNDGPGLRAYTLIMAANSLIANGESSYVQQYLWTGNSNNNHGGAIKFDLDYVVNGYSTNTCDLWEEIQSPDFFWNRITMKKAMIAGANFALKMNDTASYNTYMQTMQKINSTLYSNHWNGAYLYECTSRTMDGAVIVGLNDGFDESDGLFDPVSSEVAQTVTAYNNMFCSQYSINNADTSNKVPGILYGRYQGDTYAGGNPWILTSAALASLFYRGANHILKHGVPSQTVLGQWATAFNSPSALPTDKNALAKVFAAQGDGVLLRIRHHVQDQNFRLDEQIDRNTGVETSAHHLTWSYAEVLNAMHHRSEYMTNAARRV